MIILFIASNSKTLKPCWLGIFSKPAGQNFGRQGRVIDGDIDFYWWVLENIS